MIETCIEVLILLFALTSEDFAFGKATNQKNIYCMLRIGFHYLFVLMKQPLPSFKEIYYAFSSLIIVLFPAHNGGTKFQLW